MIKYVCDLCGHEECIPAHMSAKQFEDEEAYCVTFDYPEKKKQGITRDGCIYETFRMQKKLHLCQQCADDLYSNIGYLSRVFGNAERTGGDDKC